jgi:rhodanese-related sulfurtransferase
MKWPRRCTCSSRDTRSRLPAEIDADRLPADRATPLAIYCRSGPMSATAAATLHDHGYHNIVKLRGGMRAWQADGRPLIGA